MGRIDIAADILRGPFENAQSVLFVEFRLGADLYVTFGLSGPDRSSKAADEWLAKEKGSKDSRTCNTTIFGKYEVNEFGEIAGIAES